MNKEDGASILSLPQLMAIREFFRVSTPKSWTPIIINSHPGSGLAYRNEAIPSERRCYSGIMSY